MPEGGCTVFLVDDHAVFRSGVRTELSDQPGIEIVGEAGTVADAVAGVRELRPDVVLLDVHMPDGGGLAVLRQLLGGGSGSGEGDDDPATDSTFLALSVSDAAEDVIAVIRSGARGYVTKTISGTELADAVRRVADGDAVFSPRLAGFVLDAFARSGPDGGPGPDGGSGAGAAVDGGAGGVSGGSDSAPVEDPEVDSLTRREKEVLRLLARGYTYREIAEDLFISVKTVETHASNVLRKTQQSNRHALTRWAQSRHLD